MSPSTFHFLRIDIFCDRGSTPIPPPLLHGAELNNWLRFCYIISAQTGSQKVFIAVTSPGISGRIWDLRLASQQARIGIFVWHLKTGFGIFAWHLKQDLAWPRNAASRLFSNSWAACPLVNHHHNSYHQLIFFLVGTVCLVSARYLKK